LEAALNPNPLMERRNLFTLETVKTAAQPAPVGKLPPNAAGILSEPERVAAAFFARKKK